MPAAGNSPSRLPNSRPKPPGQLGGWTRPHALASAKRHLSARVHQSLTRRRRAASRGRPRLARPPPTPARVGGRVPRGAPARRVPALPGTLVETGTADQFQTDIPRTPLVRKFLVHIGRCDACGKRTQGRHPLQTSDVLGAAASQVGPGAQAAAVLHAQLGLSHGKVASVFQTLFGIKLTRGASPQIGQRPAARLEPDYTLILDEVRSSEQIGADETEWRIGGHPAWLHVWVGDRATAYAIDPEHSADALERVIGRDWSGVLSHDGFASYERFEGAIHQQCVALVLRRTRELLAGATRGAARFPRQIIALFTEAIHWRNEYVPGARTDDQLGTHRVTFDQRLLDLVRRPRAVPEYATLARHLRNHFEQWFAFVFDPRIEPSNWKVEQAIRPAVVNRKVWGGNRTATGVRAQGVLMSVFETCRRRPLSVVNHVSQTLRAFGN
ncbi:MAG TPA: IS66 family transposase [Gemmata sp.]